MIRTDNDTQWADTRLTGPSSAYGLSDAERDERHSLLTAAPKVVEQRRAFVPAGCDQQGRLRPSIEAAHAASEIEDEYAPDGSWLVTAVAVAAAAWAAVALLVTFIWWLL